MSARPVSAWLLPDSVADVLPSEARRLEELRRLVLDRFRVYGFELVMPPLLEYTESLLGKADEALNLRTFKLLDQASGRMLGLRADTTLQVARIDAHILNRKGIVRLCYCGPVLHTQAMGLHTTREPLQCGVELYGYSGIEADLEILSLAVDALQVAELDRPCLALSHAGLLPALLQDHPLPAEGLRAVHQSLAQKNTPVLQQLLAEADWALPEATQSAVLALCQLHGAPTDVLQRAQALLPASSAVVRVLEQLKQLLQSLQQSLSSTVLREQAAALVMDLADVANFEYHKGLVFSAYVPGCPNAVLRGGRYDNVGEAFGRARPATGFSMDLREWVALQAAKPNAHAVPKPAIRAPWGQQAGLADAVRQLRSQGEVVVQTLPNSQAEQEEFVYDRELVFDGQAWVLNAINTPNTNLGETT